MYEVNGGLPTEREQSNLRIVFTLRYYADFRCPWYQLQRKIIVMTVCLPRSRCPTKDIRWEPYGSGRHSYAKDPCVFRTAIHHKDSFSLGNERSTVPPRTVVVGEMRRDEEQALFVQNRGVIIKSWKGSLLSTGKIEFVFFRMSFVYHFSKPTPLVYISFLRVVINLRSACHIACLPHRSSYLISMFNILK